METVELLGDKLDFLKRINAPLREIVEVAAKFIEASICDDIHKVYCKKLLSIFPPSVYPIAYFFSNEKHSLKHSLSGLYFHEWSKMYSKDFIIKTDVNKLIKMFDMHIDGVIESQSYLGIDH